MNKTVNWKEHIGVILDSKNGFDIIECATCRFKHAIPLPTEKELSTYYSEKFYAESSLIVDVRKEDLEWWRMVYAEQYELFERFLPVTRHSILDIGCGLGFFLELGKERGWIPYGIEPSQQASEYAQKLGIEVDNNSFNKETASKLGNFDVVHMHEVLEHISNPVKTLKLCKELIKLGGLLCVITPNDYNPFQQLLKRDQAWWVDPPTHLNYFDTNSLAHLLVASGFEILHKTTTFPMELFLLMGENYIDNVQLGRSCHGKRKELELNLQRGGLSELKQFMYKKLSEQGVGRETIIVAKNSVVGSNPLKYI